MKLTNAWRKHVFSEKERQRIIGQYEIPKEKVFVWGEKLSDKGMNNFHIGIDNADYLLQSYFKNHIECIWMTGNIDS